jgi:hypothetical protein
MADNCVECTGGQDLDQAPTRPQDLKWVTCTGIPENMHPGSCFSEFTGNSSIEAQSKLRMHRRAQITALR